MSTFPVFTSSRAIAVPKATTAKVTAAGTAFLVPDASRSAFIFDTPSSRSDRFGLVHGAWAFHADQGDLSQGSIRSVDAFNAYEFKPSPVPSITFGGGGLTFQGGTDCRLPPYLAGAALSTIGGSAAEAHVDLQAWSSASPITRPFGAMVAGQSRVQPVSLSVVPAWSRCLPVDATDLWIYQGTAATKGSVTYALDAGISYVKHADPDRCDKDTSAMSIAELRQVRMRNAHDWIQEGYTWPDGTGRPARMLYALEASPTAWSQDRDAVVELPTDQLTAQGLVLADGKVLSAVYWVGPTDNPANGRRVLLDRTTMTFSVVVGTPCPFWERQVMKTVGGREVAFFRGCFDTFGNRWSGTFGLVDRVAGAATHIAPAVGLPWATTSDTFTDPIPLEPDVYFLAGDFGATPQVNFEGAGCAWPDSHWYQTGINVSRPWWQGDMRIKRLEDCAHAAMPAGIVVDLSNVDRIALGQQPILRVENKAYYLPYTKASHADGVMRAKLEVGEDSLVSLGTFGTCMFELYDATDTERVLKAFKGEGHNDLTLRLKAGVYTLRLVKQYCVVYPGISPEPLAGDAATRGFVVEVGLWRKA